MQGLGTPALICTAKCSVLKAVVLAALGHAYTVGDTEMTGGKGVFQPAVGAGQDVGVPHLPAILKHSSSAAYRSLNPMGASGHTAVQHEPNSSARS